MNARRLAAASVGIAAIAGTALVAASCGRTSSVVVSAGEGLVFPTVEGRNLLKQDMVLPAALAGRPAIVHVAFYQRQQLQINTWLSRSAELKVAIEGVRIVETPTMKRGWAVMASQIDGFMRSGIESDDARERTISLFVDTARFRDALGLATDEVNYVLLLDEAGRVLHVEEGAFDEAKRDRLVAAAKRG